MSAVAAEILALYETRGNADYLHDLVSQADHALQAAAQAVQAGAPDALIVAALLHDVGHLLPDVGDASGPDAQHEARGAVFLARYFPPEVTRPVGLHVTAKRYLCAIQPGYVAQLSPDSVQSLVLQGGPLVGDEVREFERRPGFREAVLLRRWDEAAKVPGHRVPGLSYYRPLIERCLGWRDSSLTWEFGGSRWYSAM
jgi:phosphonate degradation associated HDIG domain protein